jgi:hypothetical protein
MRHSGEFIPAICYFGATTGRITKRSANGAGVLRDVVSAMTEETVSLCADTLAAALFIKINLSKH